MEIVTYVLEGALEHKGIEPSYEQKRFDDGGMTNQLRLVASPNAEHGSLTIHQDAHIYLAKLETGRQATHELAADRHVWLQVLRGEVSLNGLPLKTSDGAAVSDESLLTIQATSNAEIMLFDLA